jgi:myo-inositol 2-dehydrogenase/D-chiro-inositol 1-dehydrogenase
MLKFGVSGAGYAGRYYVKALREMGWPVTGIANRTETRGTALAEEAGALWYASVQELAEKSGVEALLVATATQRHVADIEAAAKAGIRHIFCEKPAGVSPEDTEAIREIGTRYAVNIGVGYKMRFEGLFAAARGIVASGKLGALVSMTFNYYQAIPQGAWYLDSGFIRETMVHPLDLAGWLAGAEPESVVCHAASLASGSREDRASLIVRFRSGVTASLNGGWIKDYPYIAGRRNIRFEIVGTGGYLIGLRPDQLLLCDADGPHRLEFAQTDPIQEELKDFVDGITSGRPAAVGLDDALRVQHIVRAAAASAISGRAERV